MALEDAAAAVARDLADPAYDDLVAQAVEQRRWWLEQWADGAPYLMCLLAQDVQEAVHERADPLWPLCPTCRDHALFVEPDLGEDAFWVCHRSGLPIAEVGRLPEQPRTGTRP